MTNFVPKPVWLCTWMLPPAFCTMLLTDREAKAVPCSFVVKKGTNRFFRTFWLIPGPVSCTKISTTSASSGREATVAISCAAHVTHALARRVDVRWRSSRSPRAVHGLDGVLHEVQEDLPELFGIDAGAW